MNRVWGHVFAGMASVALGVLAAPSCAHDDSTIFVLDVLQQQLVTPGAPCTYTSDPTQAFVSSGVLDLALRGQYDAEYLVGNELLSQANSAVEKTETSYVTIQGAVVRILRATGAQVNSYTRLAGATIAPASGATPSFAPVSVTTIDLMTAEVIAPSTADGTIVRLVTFVKFFGQTLGGQSVESDEFEFPVDVCTGCLILGNPAGCGAAANTTSVACQLGEDDLVNICECQAYPYCQSLLQSQLASDAGAGGG